MKVLHHGSGVKIDPKDLKRHFTAEAKKNQKEYIRLQKKSKILPTKKSRFLVEFHIPTCQLQYKGQTAVKQLCEDDFRYLSVSQFKDWKNFVILRYLRAELDVQTTDNNPLQRIAEAETKDEGDNGGNDLCESSGVSVQDIVVTEQEKEQIQ